MKKENILEQIESKKAKFILIISLFLPLIALFIYVFNNSFVDQKSNKKEFIEISKSVVFIAKIDSIYQPIKTRYATQLVSKNKIFYLPYEWEYKFKVGDSISKKKGDLILEHYRNGKLIEILDYNNIFIRD
jgi:hypothetical protein